MSLKTTAEELRHRYPASTMVGNYLYVAPGESTDHVYGVQLPSRAGAGPLNLFFERVGASTRTRAPQYPPCKEVLSMLKAKYVPPNRYGGPGKNARGIEGWPGGERAKRWCCSAFGSRGRNFSPKHSLSIELRSGSYR